MLQRSVLSLLGGCFQSNNLMGLSHGVFEGKQSFQWGSGEGFTPGTSAWVSSIGSMPFPTPPTLPNMLQ